MKNIGGTSVYGHASTGSPLIGQINRFHIFLEWVRSLGGTYEPVRNLDEPKKHTDGRRNPDTKPRQYPLTTEFHTINDKGVIRRK